MPRSARTAQERVIILFENDTARDNATLNQSNVNVTGGHAVDFLPVLFARVPQAAMPHIEARPGVDSVVRDSRISIDFADEPTIESTAIQTSAEASQIVPWGVERIRGHQAASEVPASAQRTVTVAVLDTGIDYTHENLNDNVIWGANFTGAESERGLSTAADDNGHGTQVAGIVAAEDDGSGVVGVAPDAGLYSIKILDSDGVGRTSWLIEGIQAALEGPDGEVGTDDDADVVSLSVGATTGSQEMQTAIAEANERAIVIAAAGNFGDGDPSTNEVAYPANYPGSIAVAATDKSDSTPGFSSEGEEVELAAPGVLVETTRLGGGTASVSGTSAATPYVSGTAALVVASDRADGTHDLSGSDVRDRLRDTAVDIEASGVDRKAGYGLIQADVALVGTDSVGAITGKVLSSDAEPLPDATVELFRSGSADPIATETTDDDGLYGFTGLETGTDYTVEATFDGETGTTSVSALESGTVRGDIVVPVELVDEAEPALNVTVSSPETAERGEEIELRYVVTNVGNATATDGSIEVIPPVHVQTVGDRTSSLPDQLEPNESWTETYRFEIEDGLGEGPVRIASTVRLGAEQATPTAQIRVVRTAVRLTGDASVVAAPGDTVNVSYSLQNTGTTDPSKATIRITALSDPLELLENGTVAFAGSDELPEPNESVDHEFGITVPESTDPGSYYLVAEAALGTPNGETTASTITTINVQEAETPWYHDYVNQHRVVDRNGINAAISAYLSGNLGASRLNELISSYLSGTPLE